jgi:effector-binding domain-containing protein
MRYAVTVGHVPDQAILAIRNRLPMTRLPGFIGESFARIYGELPKLSAEADGEPFVMYHTVGAEAVDAEVCVPVDHAGEPDEPIRARLLPATDVAITLHVGPYEDLGLAYAALTAWVTKHGYQVSGPVRERYLNEPSEDTPPIDYRTEIEMPIEPAEVGADSELVIA